MANKKFTKKEEFYKSLEMVYDFHEQAYNTIVDLLKKKGDIELQDPISFCFLDMEGNYDVEAVRLNDKKDDFYLEATSESGDKYKLYREEINYDMIITEWLMGLKWHDVYPEYEYYFKKK